MDKRKLHICENRNILTLLAVLRNFMYIFMSRLNDKKLVILSESTAILHVSGNFGLSNYFFYIFVLCLIKTEWLSSLALID